MIYLTSKRFFYSVSALALTLQLSMPSHVFASGKGQADMAAALAGADAPAPSAHVHHAPPPLAVQNAVAPHAHAAPPPPPPPPPPSAHAHAHAHAAPPPPPPPPSAPDNSSHGSAAAVAAASDDGLDEFLAKQDYGTAYRALRAQIGAQLPDNDVMEFLVESNQYPKGKWKALSQARREEITCRVTGKVWAMNLHKPAATASAAADVDDEIPAALAAMLSQQNYTQAYNKLKAQHPHLKDAELVEFLITSNGYDKAEWKKHGATLRLNAAKRVTGKTYMLKSDPKRDGTAAAPKKASGAGAELAALLAKRQAKDASAAATAAAAPKPPAAASKPAAKPAGAPPNATAAPKSPAPASKPAVPPAAGTSS